MTNFFLIICTIILVGLFILVINKFCLILINKLPSIHKKLFNLKTSLKKKEKK